MSTVSLKTEQTSCLFFNTLLSFPGRRTEEQTDKEMPGNYKQETYNTGMYGSKMDNSTHNQTLLKCV